MLCSCLHIIYDHITFNLAIIYNFVPTITYILVIIYLMFRELAKV